MISLERLFYFPRQLYFSDDDEEDETAELLRELEKIKRERAEQREQEVCLHVQDNWAIFAEAETQQREKAKTEQEEREHDIAVGNPLLNPNKESDPKRRYIGQ